MINEYINLGEINTLKITRITDNGYYLNSKDEDEVLLPNAYINNDMKIGDIIEVFIYTDSEDRFVATTETPYGMKNQFIVANVVDSVDFGAFVDWGLPKDLFVPKNKQKTPFKVGDKRIIRIVEDEKTSRLIGVEKITSYLSNETKHLKKNQEVDILVFAKTPLGFKVIIDNTYEGMIYNNEIFSKIDIADSLKAYIKTVREDKKVDVSLQAIGKEKAGDINTKKIIQLLEQNNNELPYNYKTDPKTIQEIFAISKKAYKRALTTLIENGIISTNENGIQKL